MEFSKEDVLRLYGRQLFIVPATEMAVVAPAFQSGKAVTWKLKPQTRLALILRAEEFSDKKLTSALKGYITAAGIDARLIGFGVMEGEGDAWDLRDMPCPLGVVFGGGPVDASAIPIQDKEVHAVPSLSVLASDTAAAQSLQARLASISI